MEDTQQTIWAHVTSGQGPAECQLLVARIVQVMTQQAQEAGASLEVLELYPGQARDQWVSALVALTGPPESLAWVSGWEGTIQWICKSPLRPEHKRKNWFAGVQLLRAPQAQQLSMQDVRVDVMRASGAGGQHVNRAESAVRVTHLPTGLTAQCQQERSQHMNRKMALAALAQRLQERAQEQVSQVERQRWMQHHVLERGRAARVFEGTSWRLRR